jgi:hypothetical protein
MKPTRLDLSIRTTIILLRKRLALVEREIAHWKSKR